MLSEAEWRVMNRVWSDQPVTARQVHDALVAETGWAYTTVKTMLDRLVEKSVLKSALRAHTTHYRARLTQRKAQRSAVRGLMARAFDGAFGPMMHFLLSDERLSDKEREELQRILKETT